MINNMHYSIICYNFFNSFKKEKHTLQRIYCKYEGNNASFIKKSFQCIAILTTLAHRSENDKFNNV